MTRPALAATQRADYQGHRVPKNLTGAANLSHFLKNTKIIRRDRLRELKNREHGYFDLEFIKALEPEHRSKCVDLLETSCSLRALRRRFKLCFQACFNVCLTVQVRSCTCN